MLGKSIRKGFHTVTPYLIVQDVDSFIEFLRQAFGAEETFRDVGSAGGRARTGGSMPAMIHVYVEDVDAVYRRALTAGATSLGEPAESGDGDRRGGVQDPFCNQWWIATHLKA